jgi:hypothetical protein
MIELGQGFPEWTELGQDSGLDPLGMQRPIEVIYQSLLPGISTITLRFRYYAFFPWILKNYEDHIRNTDPAVFRVFHRRCEILFALICSRGGQELGIAGSDWAHKKLGESSGQSESNAVIDFAVGADPETEPSKRYLRNKGGAFGGIYASQMAEMGLVTMGDHLNPIPICTERALPLAAAFGASLGSMAEVFFDVVKAGSVSISVLDQLKGMKPAAMQTGGEEHRLLSDILFGKAATPSASDLMRRRTMLMLLALTESLQRIPRAEDAKWHWFGDHLGSEASSDVTTDQDVRKFWALYQACDLTRLAYETILSAALTLLEMSTSRRLTLENLVDQLVGFIASPEDQTWQAFKQTLLSSGGPAVTAEGHAAKMIEAIASGSTEDQVRSSVALMAALVEKASELTSFMDQALNAGEHFQSLRTEVRFLQERGTTSAKAVVDLMIRDRILKRHLWVASRKFRNQKAYTFLMEPEDSVLRYRDHFRVSPSSPRLDQALRFLSDVKLIDEGGLTDIGRAELVTV